MGRDGKREKLRDLVCEAYETTLAAPAANRTPAEVANDEPRFAVLRPFMNHRLAAIPNARRHEAIEAVAERARRGECLTLGCVCRDGERCHAETLVQLIRSRLGASRCEPVRVGIAAGLDWVGGGGGGAAAVEATAIPTAP